MAYSNKVTDHFEKALDGADNVGDMDEADPNVGAGAAGAPACGDMMQLFIRVGDNGVIEDAKFLAFGCGSAIASSSHATQWLKGKTVEQAESLKNSDIAQELSLPPVKIHCSVLAEDAVKSAIQDFRKKQEARRAEQKSSEA